MRAAIGMSATARTTNDDHPSGQVAHTTSFPNRWPARPIPVYWRGSGSIPMGWPSPPSPGKSCSTGCCCNPPDGDGHRSRIICRTGYARPCRSSVSMPRPPGGRPNSAPGCGASARPRPIRIRRLPRLPPSISAFWSRGISRTSRSTRRPDCPLKTGSTIAGNPAQRPTVNGYLSSRLPRPLPLQ